MDNERTSGVNNQETGGHACPGPSSSSFLTNAPTPIIATSLFHHQHHPGGDFNDFPSIDFDSALDGGELMMADAMLPDAEVMHHEPISTDAVPTMRAVKREASSPIDEFFSSPQQPHLIVRDLSMGISVGEMEEPLEAGPSTSMRSNSLTGMIFSRLKSSVTKPTTAHQQIFPKKEDIAANSLITFPEGQTSPFWCSLFYYEHSERVGEPYRCERFSLRPHHLIPVYFRPPLDEVHIDGLCAPSDGKRFCLGILSSPNRNPVVLASRRQIGKGCRLYVVGDDIYLQCLSGSPIFVQSPLYAYGNKDNLATVYRLSFGLTIKLFERQLFNPLLEQAVPAGYNAVYALQPMCQARISFVKGWGENYRRQHITATPCWVEAQFALPLQALDKALQSVAAPNDEDIHSFT